MEMICQKKLVNDIETVVLWDLPHTIRNGENQFSERTQP
jgi:hypothetical protein